MRPIGMAVLLASATALGAPGPSRAPAPTATPAPAHDPVPSPPATATLSTVELDGLPEPCRDLGKLAGSPSTAIALSARISLASCIADQKVRNLSLCDCEQSVQEVEAASQTSMALLDEVVTVGDPVNKILARQAQGDLLQGFATRLFATVPPPTDASESALALREVRLQMLTPLVNPWLVRAQSAYLDVDRLAKANPQLAKNAAVVAAVRGSRAKLAQIQNGVANR